MLRRRRVALAATASSVLVAGALTAAVLTVASGTARAAAADQCYGTGQPGLVRLDGQQPGDD
jgi:hypothetical protein